MPKHSRKNRITKKISKQKYTQKGGDFTNEEIIEMNRLGFTAEQIQILRDNILTDIQLVRHSLQQINPDTGNNFTPQELIDSVLRVNGELDENVPLDDSLNESIISNGSDDVHYLDNELDNNIDFDDNNSLHLSDLEETNDTTTEDISFGGKTRKRRTKTNKKKTIRKRRGKTVRRRSRKMSKRRRSRKMRGGNVDDLTSADFNPNLAYDSKQNGGQNIGANCYDPNFSIYNTRELTLFPYNPK